MPRPVSQPHWPGAAGGAASGGANPVLVLDDVWSLWRPSLCCGQFLAPPLCVMIMGSRGLPPLPPPPTPQPQIIHVHLCEVTSAENEG